MRGLPGAAGAWGQCAPACLCGVVVSPSTSPLNRNHGCISLSDASHSRLRRRTIDSVSPTTGSKVAAARFKHP